MLVVTSYPVAIVLCVVTMLCWGSWANTQKLSSRQWPFQLFYWDYAIGVLLLSLLLAMTLGSNGAAGRAFVPDLMQAGGRSVGFAFLGGVIFNLSNILLVAAIDIAGMAVAFPVGVGIALVLGVITTYLATGSGNVPMLSAGVGCIVIAIILDAAAYWRLSTGIVRVSRKGLILSLAAGLLMGVFFSFVARSIGEIDTQSGALEPAKLSPYSALVVFSVGLFCSNFLWNSIVMARPFQGPRVYYREYLDRGTPRLHSIGVLGGAIWNLGMALSILASSAAGPALSYGLGQGATMIGALWGVFIWKEFRSARPGTNKYLVAMFAFYALGLAFLVSSKA